MKGYTLIEVLVSIAISSILFGALIRIMGTSIPLYHSTFLQTSVNETARVQLKRIAHEIREARTSDTGAYPIVEATAHKIVFYANVDGDDATERVRYELVGTDLIRGIVKPSGSPAVYNVEQETVATIARSIYNGSGPIFVYYGSSYPTDPNPLVLP